MNIVTFAVIDIGSYELGMKIFELSEKYGMREIEFIRYRMDLGQVTYAIGRISSRLMNELCEELIRFRGIMEEYQVDVYRVCTTSAIRETENTSLVLDHIRSRTGMNVEVLSNSEQRFLSYKSIAAQEAYFHKVIQKATAIADIGGGSLQISLFDKDSLVTTQNIRLGTIRIGQKLEDMEYRSTKYISMLEDLIEKELDTFQKLYLKGREIQNLIVIGDFIAKVVRVLDIGEHHSISEDQYLKFYEENILRNPEWVAESLDIPKDYSSLIQPTLVMFRSVLERTKAKVIWAPGTYLCDGIAYDYAINKKLLKSQHNFEKDIFAATRNIAKRYMCDKKHTEIVRKFSLNIFDAMNKIHGMGNRERLLLEISALLHDCGKYISMVNRAECAYHIIMSTEIIGLSHKEREIVASAVLYNMLELVDPNSHGNSLEETDYVIASKIAAILRVANALDRSHKQKIQKIQTEMNERAIVITVNSMMDLTLERGLFEEKADFFEEVFCIEMKLDVIRSYSE